MNNYLQTVLNTIPSAVFTVDTAGTIISWNKQAERITGYSEAEVIGQPCMLFTREPCSEMCGLFCPSIKKPIINKICTLEHKNGKTIIISKNSNLITDSLGNVIGGIECFEDITEKRVFEKLLQESEQRYSAIVDSAPEIVLIHQKGNIIFVNHSGLQSSGYSKSEIIGKNILDFVETDAQKCIVLSMITRNKGEKCNNYEIEFKTKSGEILNLIVKATSILYEGEDATLAVLVDISDRKKIEIELNQKEKLLMAVSSSIHELLVNRDYEKAAGTCFELMGFASGIHSAFLFKNDQVDVPKQVLLKVSWHKDKSVNNNHQSCHGKVLFEQLGDLGKNLSNGDSHATEVSQLESSLLRSYCTSFGIESLIAMPIFSENQFWGFVTFNDCVQGRIWSRGEFSTLYAFSTALGKAIERRHIEEQLEKSRAEAEMANQLKSQFLANMSHEIRTPMNGVLGYLDLLKHTYLTDSQETYVIEATTASESLLRLLNDILDLSKIEAGKLTIEKRTFNLYQAIDETINLFRPLIAKKNLEMTKEILPTVPQFVVGDSSRFKQIISNLLSNAIKFTSEGEICFTVERGRQDKNHVEVKFQVMDTGIGIQNNKLSELFKPFIQADNSTTRQYGGTGLGLSISKELIELMDGQLNVESHVGVGSTFYFSLWFDSIVETAMNDPMGGQIALFDHIEERLINDGARILIVEDNDMNQKIVGSILKHHQIEFDMKSDGLAAYNAFCKHHYDLIFMDCQMPVMDGYESTKRIRDYENKHGLKTKIVAMTANAMEGDREKCIAAGMDDYLSKPIDFDRMVEMIREQLSVLDQHKGGGEDDYFS